MLAVQTLPKTPAMAQPLYDTVQIETPEQIEMTLPLAGIGSRAMAYLIDFFCQLVPIVALLVGVFVWVSPQIRDPFLETNAEGMPELKLLPFALAGLVIFFVNFGYFALLETLWRGQTPGKRAIGLRVIRDGGFPLDGRAALVRNLLRIVDFLPAFYVVAMLSIFWSGSGKRVGDYAAGTLVVREPRVADRRDASAADVAAGGVLSEGELALVGDFLDRRGSVDDSVRRRLAEEIASRLAARLGEEVPADAERYLEGLLSRVS